MYDQVATPNLSVSGTAGYCLSFTDDVWGSEHEQPTALGSWNSSSACNHSGEQPPSTVAVVVYWSFHDDTDAQYPDPGHVATWVPGRGVYSSPFDTKTGSQWFASIQAVTDRINQIRDANAQYLGWSEVIANVRVVQPQEDDSVAIIQDLDNWYNRVAKTVMMAEGRVMSRDEFNYWVGQDFLHLAEATEDSTGAVQHLADASLGLQARSENWQQEIADLTSQAQSDAATIDALKKQVAGDTDPNNIVITTKGWSALGQAIKSFFAKNN